MAIVPCPWWLADRIRELRPTVPERPARRLATGTAHHAASASSPSTLDTATATPVGGANLLVNGSSEASTSAQTRRPADRHSSPRRQLCPSDRAVMRPLLMHALIDNRQLAHGRMRKVSLTVAIAWSSAHTSSTSISCQLNRVDGSEARLHHGIRTCTWFTYSDSSST
jgi:hypothetical protein